MIGIFVPLAWPNVPRDVAQALTFAGICLVVIGLSLAVWKYVRCPVEKQLSAFGIVTVLDGMYKRLELIAQAEIANGVNWDSFGKTATKIIKLAGVDNPVASSLDEAKVKIKDFEKELPRILPDLKKRAQRIDWMHSVSLILDKDGFGLKAKRMNDKKYAKFIRKVDSYYEQHKDIATAKLRSLIRSYCDYVESGADALLFIERMEIMLKTVSTLGLPEVLTPTLEANMEGFSEEVREIARALRIEISQYIRGVVKRDGK